MIYLLYMIIFIVFGSLIRLKIFTKTSYGIQVEGGGASVMYSTHMGYMRVGGASVMYSTHTGYMCMWGGIGHVQYSYRVHV